MKPFQLIALAATTWLSAAAGEPADTITTVKKPAVVKVITSPNRNSIIIEGCEGDPDFRLKYESDSRADSVAEFEGLWAFNSRFTGRSETKSTKSRKRRNPSVDGACDFYAGAVIPTSADPGISQAGWEIGMLNVAKVQWRLSRCGTGLSIGIGWDYRHFTIGDGLMARRATNGAYELTPIPADYSDVKSTLRNFAVQFPVLLRQSLSGKFTVEAGGVAMLNTYTTGNSSWFSNGAKSKMPLKNLHQRILTVDVLARIGFKDAFAIYARYSPIAQFTGQYGPQYQTIAVGASLGF